MNPSPNREVVIFNAALELPASERGAYLQETCADDSALRLHLEVLLRVHEEAGGFLESQVPGIQGSQRDAGGAMEGISLTVAPSEKAGDHIGRYKLLQQIGEGGCGVVYMAEQEEPVRRRVALKVIKLGMDTRQVIARFEAERQALALMDHPNIAKVFDAGATDTGRPYFVMELIKGIPITRYCDENNFNTTARLGLFIQVCQAIQHAHQKGIIHRDIKPSNVLVADHDGVAVPKIIDFGIAKATTDQPLTDKTLFTAFEQFIGTAAYMAPEQAKLSALDVDTRSDIYSLGVLLYELLTGKTPFEAKRLREAGLDEVRRIIQQEEPLRPSTRLHTLDACEQTILAKHRQSEPMKLVHLLSGDLDWIVMKALDKDRNRRYPTANGLAMDVQRYLANEPVVACPPSSLYRLQKWAYRNKLVFAAAAGIAAALLAGTLVSTWQALRAKRALSGLRSKSEALGLVSYFNAMNLAFQKCQDGNFALASGLLDDCRSARGETDFRAFEWRYLYHLCRGNYALTLPSHKQVVGSMEFSPDSRLLATYCWDGKLRLWNVEPDIHTPIFEFAHAAGLSGFFAQGNKVVFGDTFGSIHSYDIGARQTSLIISNAGKMVAFAPGPQLVATFQSGLGIRVWDLVTGRLLSSLPGVQRRYLEFGWIESVALDPEGETLAVVDPREGPEGAASDLGIRLHDLTTGNALGFLSDERQIRAFRFSPDGELLAVGGGEGDVLVWDLGTRQPTRIHAYYDKPVTVLQFSSDGKELVTGSSDGSIKRWDIATSKEIPNHWMGHLGPVTALSFSPDGRWLASGSRDSTIKFWPCNPAAATDEVKGLNSKNFGNFAFSPDGLSLAAGFTDKSVKILDLATLSTKLVLTGMLYVVAFTPDSRHLLASDPADVAYWWDLDTRVGQPIPGYSGQINHILCVDLSPDRRLAALGLEDGTIDLWDLQSGQKIPLRGHSGPIRTLRFSSDGALLISGGSDRFVRLWDVKHKTLLTTPEDQHRGEVCAATISPDRQYGASGCGFGTIKLWNLDNFTNSLTTIVGHASALRSLAFSHRGATLVSGGEDRVVKFWNVRSLVPSFLGQTLPMLHREVASLNVSDKVRLLEFSPDDSVLAIVTDNGVLRLLRAVSQQEADAQIGVNREQAP